MTHNSMNMGWAGFDSAVLNITRTPPINCGPLFIMPKTLIFPVELCCSRKTPHSREALEALMMDTAELPYKTFRDIELYIPSRPTVTDMPWFVDGKHAHPLDHEICQFFRSQVSPTLGAALGANWLLVMLDEFDVQRVGIDIIVGFLVEHHQLRLIAEHKMYHMDNGDIHESVTSMGLMDIQPDNYNFIRENPNRSIPLSHVPHSLRI